MTPSSRRRSTLLALIPALGLLCVLLTTSISSCSDSSLAIRVIFPDEASLERARRLVLLAVDPAGDRSCKSVLGREASALGDSVLTSVDLQVGGDDAFVFPRVPMQHLLLSALVYDDQDKTYLQGCEEVNVGPGESAEVTIYLDCVPGESPCLDRDRDGVSSSEDCDDEDPCRSPLITEAKNLCGVQAADWITEQTKACRDKMAAAGTPFVPPLCGDGVDQDCDGGDAACFTDEDCDGYSPPDDCDDKNPEVNPSATESCDGKDNNCNSVVDEGCQPCDVDGDLHAAVGYSGASCDLPKDDPDDYDAGVHPETTKDTGGLEGGTVLGALRKFCGFGPDKNGKSQRDVDHDGDGLPAKDDGCPPPGCDKDGDGFASAQCSPPKSKEDCNDDDPTVFPGAPDLCGDGVAQNCVADRDCSCDGDGDKYCGPDDCNDNDKSIHPWAVEICDRKDNDCDKLVDEGNPDATGALIPTDRKLCNDDNDGECAPSCSGTNNCHNGERLSGICACSSLDTSQIYTHDPSGNRVACQSENLSSPASLRCFDATQPQTEQCNSKDFDCDGKSFVSGQSFVDKGKACGIDVATCNAGIVEGCNLSKTVPNAALVLAVMAGHGTAFNVHWVCSSSTVLPIPEACNGKDDDCNGSTATSEKDGDGDGYLPCDPCSTGSDRTDLLASLKGCDDCDDSSSSVYPGHAELCNDKDDNCVNGTSDDGKDECTSSTTCCSGQKACRNLNNDFDNCGGCGSNCYSGTANACSSGNCVCGGGSACSGGLNCVSGQCQCISNGLCSGCCEANICRPGNTVSDCGDNGVSCDSCSTSNPCKNPVCSSSGSCTTSNKNNGTGCTVSSDPGVCNDGTCCTGCLAGTSCEAGTTTAYCGQGGEACDTCTAGACKNPGCNSSGNCTTSNQPDGTSCDAGAGQCAAGTCCHGCRNSGACELGTANALCGVGGVVCVNCTLTTQTCSGGLCVP